MYSSICENAIRRKRHNQELYALFKDVEITMYTIKLTRLRWEGYVMKKKYQEIKEKILFAQSLANRKIGRSRLYTGGMKCTKTVQNKKLVEGGTRS